MVMPWCRVLIVLVVGWCVAVVVFVGCCIGCCIVFRFPGAFHGGRETLCRPVRRIADNQQVACLSLVVMVDVVVVLPKKRGVSA
jgi:hypothetical protein